MERNHKTMNHTYLATASITIHAPASRVWDALTKPELVKQYMFGTEVITNWRVGSSITYRGEWQGKSYEDKGRVLRNEPGKVLESTYWSLMSGKPDLPENYQTVRYELAPSGNTTLLTITQDNNNSPEAAAHSEQNWKMVLEGMKIILEG
jgi:uncharacterized protein YndB with AHSA1/START domain